MTGNKNLICVDMGGTSFDVSLIVDGNPDVTTETHLEGFPILTPMVNIHTIGAGGGSIAWIEGGGLRVGPISAGADPGPACYGNGGTQPTVTDANLVLGRIDEQGFLGGNMKLDYEAAFQAVKTIADELNLDVIETAEGICDIANAKMADAIRTLTVSKGIDPREFSLVAFGGAGPMHAVLIAELLEITKIVVPTVAGTFSAWGMLQTDIRHDNVRTFLCVLGETADSKQIHKLYEEMEQETREILVKQNVAEKDMEFYRTADIRYVGQEYTVNVPFRAREINAQTLGQLLTSFHELHLKIYGHNNPAGLAEIVNLRVSGYGRLGKVKRGWQSQRSVEKPTPRLVKPVVWNGEKVETNVYTTKNLEPGHFLKGPAIIEDTSSTTVVPVGYTVEVDQLGNLVITKEVE